MPTPQASHQMRLQQLQTTISQNSLTPLLLSRPSDIAYYTGFQFLLSEEREAFLLVSKSLAKLWYASFSPLPEDIVCEVAPMRSILEITQQLPDLNLTSIALDPFSLTLAEYRAISQANIKTSDLNREHIWRQRMLKDDLEQQLIIRASQITTEAFAAILPIIKTGVTEEKVASLLDAKLRQLKAEPAFPTIVAFGAHSALPHHQPTNTALEPETAILIDFGAKYQSYCSDFTRSWWFGSHSPPTYQAIQAAVQHAYQAGVTALSKPLTAQQLDAVVRTDLHQAGYGHAFIHTTGHGLGLEIHEPPSLSTSNPQELKPSMTITIEPGVYLENQFGYRLENTVLLTNSSPTVTTNYHVNLTT
jgi:Xaa-Pro aminopeptidase